MSSKINWLRALLVLPLALGLAGTQLRAAGTVDIDSFDLPPGETVTVEFQVTVDSPMPPGDSSVQNQGSVSGTNLATFLTNDPDTGAANDPTITLIQLIADLSITKTDGATDETPGTPVTYTIVAANAGPATITDGVVVDTFPGALSGCTWTASVTAGSASGFDAAGAGNINDTGITMAASSAITYVVTCNIAAAATGSLVNTASISSAGTTDPTPANNSATDTDTLTPSADVSITKTDGATDETPGTAVTYTITAANAGPSTSTGVTVADTFAGILSGCSTTSVVGGGTTGNDAGPTAGNINDSGITLPPSATVTYTTTCNIAANATGSLANTATIASGVADPNNGNDSATDTDTLTPSADLAITKTDGAATEVPGTPVTYTITVSNAGPSVATSATVADTFPGILSGCSTTSLAAGGATGNDTGPFAGNINDSGITLPVGGSISYTATCNIDAAATGSLANTATVSSAVADANGANNSATDTDTLTVTNDVSVTKTDGAATEVPGTPVTYTMVVSNSGPSTATSVTFTDTFPAILSGCSTTSVAAGSASGNDAGPILGNIADSGITLPSGGSVTYTATCNIASSATGSLANTASVTIGGGGDTNAGNDSATDTDTLAPSADLSITKTDGVTSVSPGAAVAYTIVVTNSGPSDSVGVTVADTFPATLTGCNWTTSFTGTVSGQDAGGAGAINDSGISMATAATLTYTTTGCLLDGSASGTLVNTATVTNTTADPNGANNSATDTDTILPLDYGDAPTAAQSGFAASYPTTGMADGARHVATGLTLGAQRDIEADGQPTVGADGDDTTGLPDDEEGVSFTTALVACQGANADVTTSGAGSLNAWLDWNRDGDWADSGEQIATDVVVAAGVNPVALTVPCTASVGASYARFRLSTATGLLPTGQAADGEVEDYAVTITAVGDLAITKTDGLASAVPGAGLTYTIVASNAGPSPLAGVSVTDTFPAVLSCSWTSVAAGGATGNTNNAGPANLAETLTLPVAASVTYTVACAIAPTATGTLSNTATIATTLANTSDGNAANNSATDNNTVLTPQVDLAITKTDGSATEVPGTPVTYTITVTNAGPSTDPNVTVADTFGGTLSNCSTTSIAAGGAAGNDAGAFAGNINDTAISMPPSSSVTYTSTCDISPAASGSLANTATATASVTDTVPGNDSATDTDTLGGQADLAIVKTDGAAGEVPGTPVTYTITVTNSGPSNDANVTVADSFPAALTGCSTTSVAAGGASGNDAGPFAGNINDVAISMPLSSSVTYTTTCNIAPAATGSLVNTATATSSVTDPTPGNNAATDTDTLTPQSGLAITKTDGVTQATSGGSLTYTITVANAGPSTDPSVSVTDSFPAGLSCGWTSVAAAGATGNTNNAGPANLADTLSMPPASSVTYTATCAIVASATGTLSNTATATTSIAGVSPSATDNDTALVQSADLAITKVDDNPLPTATNLTYTIAVTNNGPSDATSVVVTDTLPAALTYVSDDCGGTNTPPFTWNIGTLADGATVTCNIVTTINPAPPASISNTATVTGATADAVPGNNSATEATNFDIVPPTVTAVDTIAPTGGGLLNGEVVTVPITALLVTFSEAMQDPPGDTGTDDVTNPSNYLLVEDGTNSTIDTVSCLLGVAGDDAAIAIPAVTYDNSNPFVATLALAAPLPSGSYRLFVCGSATLRDLAGNALDNGTDFGINFGAGSIVEIPTLGGFMMVFLVVLLAGLALWRLRGRAAGQAALVLVLLVSAVPAGAVTIDSFTTNQAAVTDPPATPTVATGGADIIGTRRAITSRLLLGAGPVSTGVSGGALTATVTATTPDSRGEGILTWDGDATANNLNATGLAGQNLRASSHSAFRVTVNSASAGAELVFEVYTSATAYSRGALVLPAVTSATNFFLSYKHDFAIVEGAGADFTNVGAIVLHVRSTEGSVVLDQIDTIGPTVSANKQDRTLADVPIAAPILEGTTYKYQVVIANAAAGGMAEGVDMTDPVDTNTALIAATIRATPVAVNDTYLGFGNVDQTVAAPGVLANDVDPDTAGSAPELVVAPASVGTFATTQGGSIALAANGSFTYNPPVGLRHAVDTFTYSALDNDGQSDTGVIRFVIGQRIWFVDDASAGTNVGTRNNPFVGFTATNVAGAGGTGDQDGAGDIIFVYAGLHNTPAGIELEANQTLWGNDDDLIVDGMLIVPQVFVPSISSAGNTIVLSTNNTIRGLFVGGGACTTTGISGSNFGTLTVSNVTVAGNGAVLNLDNGVLAATFFSLGSTCGTNGIDLDTVSGTLTSGFTSASGISGTAIIVTNGGSTYNFGVTTINAPVGLNLTSNATSTFNFTSLAVTSTAGSGLIATNSGTLNIGGVTNTISAAGGPAVNATSTSFGAGATFSTVSSSGSPTNGIFLDTVTGSFVATGGSIATAAGIDFDVNAGASTITYAGTITNTANRSVEITGRTGGTVTLSGNINDTGTGVNVASNTGGTINFSGASKVHNTGANPAITLATNTGAAINFTGGGLDIDTTSGTGFNATGGATAITVQGASNSIATTTGTALNVANTTIGASGLTFQSIASNGAASGIVLNNTGATAGLTVTGTGGAGSGGTIQNTTGDGITLTATRTPSFSSMIISNTGAHGINSSALTAGFTLTGCQITGAGNGDNEHGINVDNTGGTIAINGSAFTDAEESLIDVDNNNVNLTLDLGTTSGNTFTHGATLGAFTGQAILLAGRGSTSYVLNVFDSTFTNIKLFGIQVGGDGTWAGTNTNVTIDNNDFLVTVINAIGNLNNRANTINIQGRNTVDIDASIVNNLLDGGGGGGIQLGADQASNVNANITGNVVSDQFADGILMAVDENASLTVLVDSNMISNTSSDGMEIANAIGADGMIATLNATITNNTVTNHNNNLGLNAFFGGIAVFGGADAGDVTFVDINNNNVSGNPNPGVFFDYAVDGSSFGDLITVEGPTVAAVLETDFLAAPPPANVSAAPAGGRTFIGNAFYSNGATVPLPVLTP